MIRLSFISIPVLFHLYNSYPYSVCCKNIGTSVLLRCARAISKRRVAAVKDPFVIRTYTPTTIHKYSFYPIYWCTFGKGFIHHFLSQVRMILFVLLLIVIFLLVFLLVKLLLFWFSSMIRRSVFFMVFFFPFLSGHQTSKSNY